MNANDRPPMNFRRSVATGHVQPAPRGSRARAASVLCGITIVAAILLVRGNALAADSRQQHTASQQKGDGLFSWLLYPVTGKQLPPAPAAASVAKTSASTHAPLAASSGGSPSSQPSSTLSQPTAFAPIANAKPAERAAQRNTAVPMLQQPQYFAPGSGPIIATQYGQRQPATTPTGTAAAVRSPPPVNQPAKSTVQPAAQPKAANQPSLWQMGIGTSRRTSAATPLPQVAQPTVASGTDRSGQAHSLMRQMIGRANTASAPASAASIASTPARGAAPPASGLPAIEITPSSEAARSAVVEQAGGLWQQVAGSSQANRIATSAAPTSVASSALARGLVPVPSADATTAAKNEIQSSAAGLWRPLTMQQNASDTLATGPQNASTSSATTSAPNSTESGRGPIADTKVGSFLLQPFYATNGNAAQSSIGGTYPSTAVTSGVASDLGSAVRNSSLVQQLAPAIQNRTLRRLPSIEPAATPGNAELVAYLQEEAPQPEELDINEEGQPEIPPGPATAGQEATENGESAGGEGSLAEAERLGRAPEDNTLEFLRTETVLLKPGDSQCDVGLNYLLVETDFPILLADDMGEIVGVDEVDFRIRELTLPIEYRLGLHPRVQGFIGAPIGWSNTQLALDNFEAFQNDGGFGDIDFGLTMQLHEATANKPYVIANISATAPTGGDPFTGALGLAPTAPSLGQGFWSVSGSLLCIKPYDPIVFFYGIGTERFFEREFVGLEIRPGAQYTYNFGVGFAVNERVTLSTRFNGAYVEELEVNGQRRFGTNTEPMTIRFSATISQPCDRLVEPFVEFGITDDAISSFFGVTWTFSHIHKEAKNSQTQNGNGSQETKTPESPSEE